MRIRQEDGFLRNDGNLRVFPPMDTGQSGVMHVIPT